MKKDVIVLENIFFEYEKTPILENVNLKIKEGDFVGFIGPNGGGKTTLLKIILGLLKPQKGLVKIFEKEPQAFFAKFGYVPQVTSVDKSFPITVMELVLLGSLSKISFFEKYPKEIKEKAKLLLEKVGLYPLRNHSFGSLSGGETQRALIARALICDPEILVLDEPTANIDKLAEQKIFDLILNFSQKNPTILMVNHDLNIIINQVKKIVFVQKKVTTKLPHQVCEHFALGLYHEPLKKNKKIKPI